MRLFISLANEPFRNSDYLFLLLIVTCKSIFDEKLKSLRALIFNTTELEKVTDKLRMERERFVHVFEALFTLCSVMVLNEI